MMSKKMTVLKNEFLKDPDFKKEYDNLQPDFAIVQAIYDARIKKHLTQKELSKLTGISQADISRIENGNSNPSLSVLKRLANGMGMKLKLEFIPLDEDEIESQTSQLILHDQDKVNF